MLIEVSKDSEAYLASIQTSMMKRIYENSYGFYDNKLLSQKSSIIDI